ncbi:hypothetical protein EXE41_12745 [Halorubrum sp. SD690R]|nr:hypothetical protein EXE41_12745 [Halorubrum sp. SD690R]
MTGENPPVRRVDCGLAGTIALGPATDSEPGEDSVLILSAATSDSNPDLIERVGPSNTTRGISPPPSALPTTAPRPPPSRSSRIRSRGRLSAAQSRRFTRTKSSAA